MKEEELQTLRDAIERKMGYGLNTPSDFKKAAAAIVEKTGRSISSTTLMRIWGYVRDGGINYHPTLYSISTLAMLLDYIDFKDFTAHYMESDKRKRNMSGIKKTQI